MVVFGIVRSCDFICGPIDKCQSLQHLNDFQIPNVLCDFVCVLGRTNLLINKISLIESALEKNKFGKDEFRENNFFFKLFFDFT